MEQNFVINLALRWFRASGPRTKERLDSLVEHQGKAYGIEGEHLSRLQEDAWKTFQAGCHRGKADQSEDRGNDEHGQMGTV